jgi:hypothetical protein
LSCLRDYEAQIKAGRQPTFVASQLGIDNTAHWKAVETPETDDHGIKR